MEELDEFEGGEEVDYDFNLDDDLLNDGKPPLIIILTSVVVVKRLPSCAYREQAQFLHCLAETEPQAAATTPENKPAPGMAPLHILNSNLF